LPGSPGQKVVGQYIQDLARHHTLDVALTTGTSYQLNTHDGEKGFADAVAAAEVPADSTKGTTHA
jgi:hypothetical protein